MALLFDTDVLIDYLRGHENAASVIEANHSEAFLSALTVAELFQGVRDGKERLKLTRTLSAFNILPVTQEIAERGGLFSRDFRKSHGCGLADCLIAATADLQGLTLITLNTKHYPMLEAVKAPYTKAKGKSI